MGARPRLTPRRTRPAEAIDAPLAPLLRERGVLHSLAWASGASPFADPFQTCPMTINRIGPWLPPLGGAAGAGTWWVLRARCGGYYLSATVARRIQRQLGRWWAPRWIVFTDLSGSQVCVRRADVRALVESTPTTRAADRRIERAREEEEKADEPPPWADGA